jgi:hypothetical protein
MATVPAEITWVTGQVVTAAQLNANLRDAINFLIAPPLFVGRQTVAQSVNTAAWTALALDAEDKDSDGMHSTVTNTSRATAQTQGWYDLQYTGGFAADASTNTLRAVAYHVNGANRAGKTQTFNDGTDIALTGGASVFLNVGDYTEAAVFQNRGSALNTASQDGNPRFQVRWIST